MSGVAACRLSARGIIRSEWSKLWSLRSFWIPLLCVIAFTAGLGGVLSASYRPGRDGEVDPIVIALLGMNMVTAVIAGLGIVSVTGEYSHGGIRSSMTAVPRRLPVLWAKVGVFGVTMLVIFLVADLGIFMLSQSMLSGTDMRASLADPGVARALVGLASSAAYYGILGVIIGMLVRHTAGAIGAYVGVVYLAPLLIKMLPWAWAADVVEFLPSKAVEPLTALHPGPGALSPLASYLVMGCWVLLGGAVAGSLLTRRDV